MDTIGGIRGFASGGQEGLSGSYSPAPKDNCSTVGLGCRDAMKKPFWAGTSLHGPSASRVLVLVRSHLPPTHASQGCSRNHVVKTEFLKPRLVGERFNAHSIPVEVLKDWAAFEGLIVEAARWLYLQENPRRTRTPRGFAQSFTRRTVTR